MDSPKSHVYSLHSSYVTVRKQLLRLRNEECGPEELIPDASVPLIVDDGMGLEEVGLDGESKDEDVKKRPDVKVRKAIAINHLYNPVEKQYYRPGVYSRGRVSSKQPPMVGNLEEELTLNSVRNDSFIFFQEPAGVSSWLKLIYLMLGTLRIVFLGYIYLLQPQFSTDNLLSRILWYPCIFLVLTLITILGVIGAFKKSLRLLTLFLAVGFIDAFISVLLIHSIVFLGNIAIEVILLALTYYIRSKLMYSWFPAAHIST